MKYFKMKIWILCKFKGALKLALRIIARKSYFIPKMEDIEKFGKVKVC